MWWGGERGGGTMGSFSSSFLSVFMIKFLTATFTTIPIPYCFPKRPTYSIIILLMDYSQYIPMLCSTEGNLLKEDTFDTLYQTSCNRHSVNVRSLHPRSTIILEESCTPTMCALVWNILFHMLPCAQANMCTSF